MGNMDYLIPKGGAFMKRTDFGNAAILRWLSYFSEYDELDLATGTEFFAAQPVGLAGIIQK